MLQAHLHDPYSSFSVGALGALAEFHRAADEPLVLDDAERLTVATLRGALRIERVEGVTPRAYETLSRRTEYWQQGVLFCLPAEEAAMNRRGAVTELGPDEAAIRHADRGAVLFDMGLGALNVDFCVRTAEPALLSVLRRAAGQPILAPGNPAMAAILEASPHRVACSRLARAEVYQAIGRERTPEGPHTHVLPQFLASGRTHEPEIPLAAGCVPGLSLYPANPLTDSLGRRRPFDPNRFQAFEGLLTRWGDPHYLAEKQRLRAAVTEGLDPVRCDAPATALGRTAFRVALRQLRQNQGARPELEAWSARFDETSSDGHTTTG